MPDMDGENLLRAVRAVPGLERVPFIAVSAVRSEARIRAVLGRRRGRLPPEALPAARPDRQGARARRAAGDGPLHAREDGRLHVSDTARGRGGAHDQHRGHTPQTGGCPVRSAEGPAGPAIHGPIGGATRRDARRTTVAPVARPAAPAAPVVRPIAPSVARPTAPPAARSAPGATPPAPPPTSAPTSVRVAPVRVVVPTRPPRRPGPRRSRPPGVRTFAGPSSGRPRPASASAASPGSSRAAARSSS